MLTSGDGDIEFEPPQTKVYPLGVNILILAAGDAADQSAICAATHRRVTTGGVLRVDEAAQIYADEFADYRKKINERAVLKPLGLDLESFIDKQSTMLPGEASDIRRDLTYDEVDIEAIVTGVDEDGGHIYVIQDPGQARRYDSIGFAAIGIGKAHANSQFMFAGFQRSQELPDSMMLLYKAKKRAEVAPGVGTVTDIYSINRAATVAADSRWMDKLEEIYQDTRILEDTLWGGANNQLTTFVMEVLSDRAREQQEAEGEKEGGTQEGEGVDEEGVSGEPTEGEPTG